MLNYSCSLISFLNSWRYELYDIRWNTDDRHLFDFAIFFTNSWVTFSSISNIIGLNSMIMEVMKPQIAAGSRGVSVAYGEILFRVWKDFSVDRKGDEAVSIEVSWIRYFEGYRILTWPAIDNAKSSNFSATFTPTFKLQYCTLSEVYWGGSSRSLPWCDSCCGWKVLQRTENSPRNIPWVEETKRCRFLSP